MTDALRHRGPDDGDVAVVSAVAPAAVLGHRRLSILDLSSAGRQPMCDIGSGVTITYNGEIYNFRELRRELESRGHRFLTATDTEVIVRGYVEWGTEVFARLRGIFAIGLWDPRVRKLLLARDRLGVKPLYLFHDERRAIYASEVRALLASGLVPRSLDVDGLRSYLAYGSVQEPLTMIRNVRSLPPGTMAWVDDQGIREHRYYSLPLPADVTHGAPTSSIRDTLRDAVQSQLVADVPLGAFLSGGIDSTAIALLMGKSEAVDVRTFNVCFRNGGPLDERRFARIAASSAHANHTDIELGEEEFLASLDMALSAYDQPSTDGVNTWFVSRAVREAGLTVALSGVGGDELFVGYNRFTKALRAERAGRLAGALPVEVRKRAGRALESWGRTESSRQAGMMLASTLSPYFSTRRMYGSQRADALLSASLRDGGREDWAELCLRPLDEAACGTDAINRVSWLELQSYMLSTLLRDTDQMSMAHALEVRVPLLDHHIVDLILPIPGAQKVSPVTPKRLLVEALGDAMPEECVRRPKRGFTLPFDTWLRSPGGRRETQDRLLSGANGVLDQQSVMSVMSEFDGARIAWSRLWTLFVVTDWIDRHGVTV